MHNFTPLLIATWQSIYMVFIASFLSIALGLLLGTCLFVTSPKQFFAHKPIHCVLGYVINITRSVPFIILLISIIPLTRWIIGTSIGTNAAIVPLTIAAIPFFARVVESALEEVPHALIETAHALGASPWHIITKVLIPESLPSLIKGGTLTIISLIGYSAMAGVVGGGGLGELAINYGYQQFNVTIMMSTVVILIILVQFIQSIGNYLVAHPRLKPLGWTCLLLWIICIGTQLWPTSTTTQRIKVGIVSGPQEKILRVAQDIAQKRYGLHIQLVVFNDYQLPNEALAHGDIDANIFQHIPFLQAQCKAHHYALSSIGKTFVYPFGFYSRRIKILAALPNDATIAIPNDPSNESRALLLLQQAGLIRLRAKGSTPHDIISNPKNLRFILLDAAQLPRALNDADLVGLTNDYLQPAGLHTQDAILKEGANSPYANIIAVRTDDKNLPVLQKLVSIMHSKPVQQATEKIFPDGAAIPAW